MSNSRRAEFLINERVIADIRNRLNTYLEYLQSDSILGGVRAREARERICDWAVDDIDLLLTERDKLMDRLVSSESLLFDIQNRPNCNDCGIQKTCEYRPAWGANVRYGCPLWEA